MLTHSNLRAKASNVWNDQCQNNNQNNSILNEVRETLKLEIINKGTRTQRHYKLSTDVKFEHFYDYFSSELRSNELLHVIDNMVISKEKNEQVLENHTYKDRDILINHIDPY